MTPSVDLVGRDIALRALRAAIDGTDRVVCITGPEGVGRSRLLAAALDAAAGRGMRTGLVRASVAAARVPFAVVAPLVDPPARALSATALLQHVVEAWTARPGPRPVVGVDDAHLLDDESAALVHLLATTEDGPLVIVTMPSGTTPPRAVTAAVSDAGAIWLELRTLTSGEIEQWLGQALGGPVDPATSGQIVAASGGNPLWVHELLLAARSHGALERSATGQWQITALAEVSDRLDHIVSARLLALPQRTIAVANWLALADRPLSADALRLLVDFPEGGDVVAEAELAGIVTVVSGARDVVDLAHPIHRAVLNHHTSVAGRRERHRRLAEVLLSGAEPTEDDVLTATLSLRAAGDRPDGRRLHDAARSALARGEAGLALELARAGTGDGRYGRKLRAVATAASLWLGMVRDADPFPAVENGPLTPEEQSLDDVGAAVSKAASLFLVEGKLRATIQILDEVLTAVALNHPMHGPAVAVRCAALISRGWVDEAWASLDRPDHSDGAVRAAVVSALTWSGRPLDAIDVGHAAADADCGPVSDIEKVLLVTAQVLAGHLDVARDVAQQAHLEAAAKNVPTLRAMWAQSRGAIELAAGDARLAAPLLREAATLMFVHPTGLGPAAHGHCLGDLAEALILIGDPDGATRALDEASALPLGECVVPALTFARARLVDADGDRPTAVALLRPVVADAVAHGSAMLAVQGLVDLARLGEHEAVQDGLAVLRPRLQGSALQARTEVADAMVVDDPVALTAAADKAGAAGLHGLAAEALDRAARSYHDRGAVADAVRTVAAGRSLARARGPAVTPDRRTPPLTARLTPREHLVARYASAGTDNATIAATLHLSRRTVETHLQRSYAKLGIHSRRQLRALIDGFDDSGTPGEGVPGHDDLAAGQPDRTGDETVTRAQSGPIRTEGRQRDA